MKIDSPNSIHVINRLQEEGDVEQRYKNFRLIYLTQEELYIMGVLSILDDDDNDADDDDNDDEL